MKIKPEVQKWLLEENNPSSKYLAEVFLFNLDKNSPEALEDEKKIYEFQPIKKILEKIEDKSIYDESISPYAPKYKAIYWQAIILSQLGASIRNEKVKELCEFIFKLQHSEGGFTELTKPIAEEAYLNKKKRLEKRGKKIPKMDDWVSGMVHESELSCLTGNIVSSLINLGYPETDSRIEKAFKWLTNVQNTDGGWLCPYWRAHIKDKHSCFLGTICSLDALSLIPEGKRIKEIKSAIEKGAEFLLMHRLYKADHHDFKVISEDWLKLKFPLFFYDFLRGLVVIERLGYLKDKRLSDAINLLLSKESPEGKWNLEKTPEGRMYSSFGKVGEPNKWVTISALKVIKEL